MLPLENITVGALLRRTAETYAGRDAVWYKGEYWNYAQLDAQVQAAAGRFLAAGIRKGDHVALWGEIEPAALAIFYGLQRIGAIAVMLNTSLGQRELQDRLAASDTRYLCVGQSYKNAGDMGQIGAALGRTMPLAGVWGFGEASPACLPAFAALPAADSAAVEAAAAQVDPQDTAVILFTSGSTSVPKAVLSSHYSRVNSGIQQAADMECSCEDRFCVSNPMFHCFCISVNLMAAVAVGGCLCIPRDRHVASITECIETCGCTMLSTVPTLFHAIISKPDFDPKRYATLRTGVIGGAAYAPEEFLRIERELDMLLMSSLGQTETTAGLTICWPDDSEEVRSTTIGHFMNHTEGKIIDIKTGETLPAGKTGEICVRGYLTMQGYYKQPELTAKTLDAEGWVHTGDLGCMDEAGNITLQGRLKELIIRGGENISPVEIEAALGRLDAVDVCKVVGVPDAHYGEQICACIRRRPGMSLTEGEVKQHLRSLLAEFKVPAYVLFFEEFPVTATGKILSKATAQLAAEKLGLK